MTKLTVKCPTCGKLVEWEPQNAFRPFCSERCKLIDLGEWASDSRVIEGPSLYEQNEDLDADFDEPPPRHH